MLRSIKPLLEQMDAFLSSCALNIEKVAFQEKERQVYRDLLSKVSADLRQADSSVDFVSFFSNLLRSNELMQVLKKKAKYAKA